MELKIGPQGYDTVYTWCSFQPHRWARPTLGSPWYLEIVESIKLDLGYAIEQYLN